MTNFKEDLIRVKAFVFDIDGVLSLQTISVMAAVYPGVLLICAMAMQSAGSGRVIAWVSFQAATRRITSKD